MGVKKRVNVVSDSQTDMKESSFQGGGLPVDSGDDSWNELCTQYPNDPRLVPLVIYALPVRLIELLHQFIPSLLTAEEL